MTTRYRYLGPDSAITFRSGHRTRLIKGAEVDLPEDSKFVAGLLARGMLVEVQAELPAPAAPAASPTLPASPAPPAPTPTLALPAKGEADDEPTPSRRGKSGKRN